MNKRCNFLDKILYYKFISIALALLLSAPALALDYSCLAGTPTVVDGNTLRIDDYKIRLEAIAAPDLNQVCQDKNGKPYQCGEVSKQALSAWLVQSLPIRCCPNNYPFEQNQIISCFREDGKDVGQYMVVNGYAIAQFYPKGPYKAEQDKARRTKAGLWQGRFNITWQYWWNK